MRMATAHGFCDAAPRPSPAAPKLKFQRALPLLKAKILQALNPLEIEWEGTRRSIGASIGASTVTGEMLSESDWMEAADKACYQAKAHGRGQMQVARA